MNIRCVAVGLSVCNSGIYSTNPLPSPVRDIEALVDWIKSRGLELTPDNTRILTNERATCDAIIDRLEWAAQADLTIFLYSGHGTKVADRNDESGEVGNTDNCLVSADFDWSREDTWLTDDKINVALKKAKVLAIVDACHSGTIYKSLGGGIKSVPMPLDMKWRISKNPKPKVTKDLSNSCWLSACADNETALDLGDLSLLTKAIVNSSGSCDTMKEVHDKALALAQGNQTPQLYGDYNFTGQPTIQSERRWLVAPNTKDDSSLRKALAAAVHESKEKDRLIIWQQYVAAGHDPKLVSAILMEIL